MDLEVQGEEGKEGKEGEVDESLMRLYYDVLTIDTLKNNDIRSLYYNDNNEYKPFYNSPDRITSLNIPRNINDFYIISPYPPHPFYTIRNISNDNISNDNKIYCKLKYPISTPAETEEAKKMNLRYFKNRMKSAVRTLKKKVWSFKDDKELKLKIEYNINQSYKDGHPVDEPTISISKIRVKKELNVKDNNVEGFEYNTIYLSGKYETNDKTLRKIINKLLPEIKFEGQTILFRPKGDYYNMLYEKWKRYSKLEGQISINIPNKGGKNNKTKKRKTKRK